MKDGQAKSPSVILLTGGAGFLGKVVMEDLLRRQDELGFEKIILLIRPKSGKTALQRFNEKISRSECFRLLPSDWVKKIEIVNGDLADSGWGLEPSVYRGLALEVTHIIHCAASVDFNLPMVSAAKANITSTLSVLDFAKICEGLVRFVSVSTAYVTPHRTGEIHENLVSLPVTPEHFYEDIRSGKIGHEEALAKLGHANSYTLTKCIAEHLLLERRGEVPLTIVRPSIISAALKYPFPGWIDSYAALAGFIASYAAGFLRVIASEQKTRLDVIPVDRVAKIIVDQAFSPDLRREVPIVHAVAGLNNALPIDMIVKGSLSYFERYSHERKPVLKRIGPIGRVRQIEHLAYHRAPLRLVQVGAAITGQKQLLKQSSRIDLKLDAIFKIFVYFTHNTFQFAKTVDQDFVLPQEAYISSMCEGVYTHLLRRDPRRQVLAGSLHRSKKNRISKKSARRTENETIRATAIVLKKSLDRMFLEVSFDQASFEKALVARRDTDCVVIVPTHRSYVDFLLCSYLFFTRTSLGVSVPHIAAAEEFSRLPGLGLLFERMGAFYIKRGMGQEDPGLTAKLEKLTAEGKTIQFFIEGQRSRSRHFLAPKRGILRGLQKTGKTFLILPVTISYDRICEEAAVLKQMKGLKKEPMSLGQVAQWAHRLTKSQQTLGNVHMQCGNPIRLEADSDVPALSLEILSELQRCMTVSSYHLECFLKANPKLHLNSSDLAKALEQRGARILSSHLHKKKAPLLDSTLERSFRMQWIHFFIPDALDRHAQNQAILSYSKANLYLRPADTRRHARFDAGPNIDSLIGVLFEPICHDYENVATAAWAAFERRPRNSRQQILEHAAYLDRPTAEVVLDSLISENLVLSDKTGSLSLGGNADLWREYIRKCRWHL